MSTVLRPALLLLSLALSTACSTLSTDTPTTRVGGTWVLDSAASEAPGPKVDKLVSKQEAQWRARFARLRAQPAGSEDTDTDAGDIEGPDGSFRLRPDFKALRVELQQALTPAPRLRVEVRPELVRITVGELPGIDYRAGEEFSRFDEHGTARVDSGWSADAFVIRARYTNGGVRTERYGVDASGAQLAITQRFDEPGLGRIEVRSIYRRA